jgi:hypothetical protein
MVKEKKISVIYMVDPLGVHKIITEDLWDDEDADDDGIEDHTLAHRAELVWGGTVSGWAKIKLLTSQVFNIVKSDAMLWFALYASWVNVFIAYTYTTYFWLYITSFVGKEGSDLTQD